MSPRPRRVAIMLDLRWPYKRHSEIFAGVQRWPIPESDRVRRMRECRSVTVSTAYLKTTLKGQFPWKEREDNVVGSWKHELA